MKMKAFAELETIKYIVAHAFYGEYNFKQQEVSVVCDNGSQLEITYLAGGQLVQILIPVELVEQYLASKVNKAFPVSGYGKDGAGNLIAYMEGIELDNVKFIEIFDQWANNPRKIS